jgi:hypothetical protein
MTDEQFQLLIAQAKEALKQMGKQNTYQLNTKDQELSLKMIKK